VSSPRGRRSVTTAASASCISKRLATSNRARTLVWEGRRLRPPTQAASLLAPKGVAASAKAACAHACLTPCSQAGCEQRTI
jgi:hypothetical protein